MKNIPYQDSDMGRTDNSGNHSDYVKQWKFINCNCLIQGHNTVAEKILIDQNQQVIFSLFE